MKKLLPVLILLPLLILPAVAQKPNTTVWQTEAHGLAIQDAKPAKTKVTKNKLTVTGSDNTITYTCDTGEVCTASDTNVATATAYNAHYRVMQEDRVTGARISDSGKYVILTYTQEDWYADGSETNSDAFESQIELPEKPWYQTAWEIWTSLLGFLSLMAAFVGLAYLVVETIRRAWVSEPNITELVSQVSEIDDDLDTVEKELEEQQGQIETAFNLVESDMNLVNDKIDAIAPAKKTRKKKA